jgi:hypothetical protein
MAGPEVFEPPDLCCQRLGTTTPQKVVMSLVSTMSVFAGIADIAISGWHAAFDPMYGPGAPGDRQEVDGESPSR